MKKLVQVVYIFVIALFLCGCNNKKTDEIQFATWGSKTEMSIIKPIVEDYNKTHSIKVKLIHIPQNYFQKLHLLFASKLAPDVIFMNNLYLKIYQKADLFEDLTPYINKEDYFQNALSTMTINGKIYAIPRDVSSFVIFYNKDIFKKAEITPDKNWNINKFYETTKELKKYSDAGFCTEFSAVSWGNFVSVENKPMFLDGELTISEEKSLEALQKLADKINKEGLGANKEQLMLTPCAQLFLTQKTPIFVSGRWSVPKLDSQAEFEYGVLPFPKGQSKYYIPLDSSGWAVSKTSKNKEAAVDFVKYISSDENIEKMTESGLITPAKKKIAQSEKFKNGEVFAEIIEKSTPDIVPADYNIKIDKINKAAESVLGGYKTAKEMFSTLK